MKKCQGGSINQGVEIIPGKRMLRKYSSRNQSRTNVSFFFVLRTISVYLWWDVFPLIQHRISGPLSQRSKSPTRQDQTDSGSTADQTGSSFSCCSRNCNNTLFLILDFDSYLPVNEDVQHSLCGGEGPIGGEEDGDEGGISQWERVEEVEHQLLFRSSFHALGTGNVWLEVNRKIGEDTWHACRVFWNRVKFKVAYHWTVRASMLLFDHNRVDNPFLFLLHHSGL